MRPKAVIFDRDGTLASCQRHLVACEKPDWDAFNASLPFDAPVPAVATLFRLLRYSSDVRLIITTGRMDFLRPAVLAWLDKHNLMPDRLFMRATGDQRPDYVVKEEMYREWIEPEFDVQLAIDDRPTVVAKWRELGIPVIAVEDPGLPPTIGDKTTDGWYPKALEDVLQES